MNSPYDEQEQLDVLRRWWDNYGRPVVIGGGIGLAALLGYQWYENREAQRAVAASALYQQFTGAGESEPVEARDELVGTYPRSPYGVLALLQAGSDSITAGRFEDARRELQSALDSARDPKLKELARLNLARVELAADAPQAALDLARQRDEALYPGLFQELVGDAYIAQGEVQMARDAYQAALDSAMLPPELAAVVRLKLDAIPATP